MTKREICERLLEILVQSEDHIDVNKDIRDLILDIAAPEAPDDHFADPGKKMATLPEGTPINLCGSPDDIVPDGNGGWRRRGDEAIAYTYGTGTNEASR